MAISKSIKALINGETVSGSSLNDKLVKELIDEGLLHVDRHGSRKTYRARNVSDLKRYLQDKDESYLMLDMNSLESRAAMAEISGNSKLTMVRSCPGFAINSYESVACVLNGCSFEVNPPEGSFIFVTDWKQLEVSRDVTIIGIENMENFRMIRKQRLFFEHYLQEIGLSQKVLFVSRYPQSNDLRSWLSSIPNYYLHFGDFDLAGIHIFQTEFQKWIGVERSSFLIPKDIENRIRFNGSSKRFDNQYERFKDVKSECKDIQHLIDVILQNRKGYDQEGYISKPFNEDN